MQVINTLHTNLISITHLENIITLKLVVVIGVGNLTRDSLKTFRFNN
jgi:hypothetical protein